MPREIRFGAFVREINARHKYLSYNRVTPKPKLDRQGNEIPYRAPKIRLRSVDAFRLIKPYVSVCGYGIRCVRSFH